jgi:pimeloyl-ACP methyl ester carboxylesterase
LLLASAAAAGAGIAATAPPGPLGDALYLPPNPLPQYGDGAVIWAQRFSGGAALPTAAANYRMLYETFSATGPLVAVSGTLAVPPGAPPTLGWPLISWAHGTTGNAPQCAPSRSLEPNIEQRMLDGFVRRGYAVAQTDYEGIGTPGTHPYMVALSAARDVTAIVKASREIAPQIGRNWIVMGHSQGGAAALATAAVGQQLAPELDLVGAVAYAPFSTPDGMLQYEYLNEQPNSGLVILALMIEGFSTVDPRVAPSKMLEPEALRLMPELQQQCLPALMSDSDWIRLTPRNVFRSEDESDIQAFYHDLIRSDPRNFSISIPTLLVNGASDSLVSSASTIDLREQLSKRGTPVAFKAYAGATHGTVLSAAADDVAEWIGQRFAASAGDGSPSP